MKLTFYGGTRTVTGANYLLEAGPSTGGVKILVDCGMFQGSKYAEGLNYEKFPYDPAEIDFVFITHSHMDHIGRLPKLYKDGFRGPVYASEPTKDIMAVAFPDALDKIVAEAKETGAEKLYGKKDIDALMALTKGVRYKHAIDLGSGVSAILHDAGHILGSSMVEINDGSARIIFSGDLGNSPAPLLDPPDYVKGVDYAVLESTYGDRVHEDKSERKELLETIIRETMTRGGTLMMPSFAIERTQELLFEIDELIKRKKIPQIPIFVDSPLAINITKVYQKFSSYLNEATGATIKQQDGLYNFPWLKFTFTTDESKKINDVPPPKIIIAGSGMSNGGRILHHESRYLPDPHSTLLIVGYQAEGTLGRRILDGAKEVKIFGEKVPVRCFVKAIGGYSAHADQNKLLNWLKPARLTLKKIFLVQGEEDQMIPFAQKIRDELAIETMIPLMGEEIVL